MARFEKGLFGELAFWRVCFPWRQVDLEKIVCWSVGIASAPLKLTLNGAFSGLCGGIITCPSSPSHPAGLPGADPQQASSTDARGCPGHRQLHEQRAAWERLRVPGGQPQQDCRHQVQHRQVRPAGFWSLRLTPPWPLPSSPLPSQNMPQLPPNTSP